MSAIDLPAFIARIGLERVESTPRGLAALQAAHLRAIPFETVAPLLGEVPDLSPQALADKIISCRRGGYCFELNTLLGLALEALGFEARRVMARVRLGAAEGGPRSHLAWIVPVEGRSLLVDAGFGGPGPLEPLDLDTPEPQTRPNGTFRAASGPQDGERTIEMRRGTEWFALYDFDETRVLDHDIAAANFLCARWPAMPFPDHLMANGYRGATRIGLFDRMVTRQPPDGPQQRAQIDDAEGLEALLVGELGLGLDRTTVARVWARIKDAPATAGPG
ncbi:arylamine N-acetyltransferase [Rhodobacteraceae bacterium WD3A24]|nr:arylamine N-acetyltransferase [Rhodobacteraceae bacterium WD3A24]